MTFGEVSEAWTLVRCRDNERGPPRGHEDSVAANTSQRVAGRVASEIPGVSSCQFGVEKGAAGDGMCHRSKNVVFRGMEGTDR